MVTHSEARSLLRDAVGNNAAEFMKGQWNAIDAIVNERRRVLLVQRTGWGKSMVYFLSTKLLRDSGVGTTLIISPLLALMRDQMAAARRLSLTAETINSTNTDEWPQIMARVRFGEIDVLLISPERFENPAFIDECLLPIADNIEFLVVDEAHCISDWGHDFRPSYQRINRLIRELPSNVAVLATTATANERVVEDVLLQLGADTELQRGPLTRDSIALQATNLPDRASRLAWLALALPQLEGSGIVYTSTVRDAKAVTAWLKDQNILAEAYYGALGKGAERDDAREVLEKRLLNNDIKVLVSTNALGMGFDKPDLAFVVHFQAPQSIVHYYQQVGRAGRGIESAYGILMSGAEDDDIVQHFIDGAFPDRRDVNKVLDALDEADDGLSVNDILKRVNLQFGQVEQVLKLLSVADSSPISKRGSRWYRTANRFVIDEPRIQRLAAQRNAEWARVKDYASTKACLMSFLSDELDGPPVAECGRCENCLGVPPVNIILDRQKINEAARFIRRSEVTLHPRKQWISGAFENYGWRGNIRPEFQNYEGRSLSIWRDSGWSPLVEAGKQQGRFSDELIQACREMVDRWGPNPPPEWVTCVPSLRSQALVPDFARRLADVLKIPFRPAVSKVQETQRQISMKNSWQQAHNLDGAFAVDGDEVESGPVLLVDDVVDSRWSLTVTGALLLEAGSGPVLPLVLAQASASNTG
jgi:ATP-dependent DNA helicase RecQ